MPSRWLEIAKGMLRLTRAERALTLAIFVLFQAMLPSYAGAMSEWSGQDRLVLCTSHGLIGVDDPDEQKQTMGDEALCLVAQSAAADLAETQVWSNYLLPQLGISPLAPQQLMDFRRGLHLSPHSPRAPPKFS